MMSIKIIRKIREVGWENPSKILNAFLTSSDI